ncbi:sensor domain-containing diguanylate cyclase [Thaumasiovibrio subtropicus]|uniref:sensor domain-containing diguanylate cyclase n=1 Tax=Thaumasiovibrio subtropicus TaxID=1891207 RepID=UPI000B34B235|nr:sensor domain-containing diguanylate cyclase [Thaumasiovibrio subtropicus]
MVVELHPHEYRKLLESTRAIPWRMEWPSLRYTYMGPQIDGLLGWPASSWDSINDWIDRIHHKDRERVVETCLTQSTLGNDHEVDYRAITQKGDYVWVRNIIRVIRDANDDISALVGIIIDIHERKLAERELERANQHLLKNSVKDTLTGIANRRMFDETLSREWHRAMRLQTPLSLLVVDIDYFSRYNELYGYLQGDNCLKSFSRLLESRAKRACDLAARIQDEEFVLLYPDTDLQAAKQLAVGLQEEIALAAIPFPTEISRYLTVSVGVASLVPNESIDRNRLYFLAGNELYNAKQQGRNCCRAV